MSTSTRPAVRIRGLLALGAAATLAAGLTAFGCPSALAAPPAGCSPTADISYTITGLTPAQVPARTSVPTGATMNLVTTNPACDTFMVFNRITVTTDADVPPTGLVISLTTGSVTDQLFFSGSGGTYTADYGPPAGFPLSAAAPVTATVDVPPGAYTLTVDLIDAAASATSTGVSAAIGSFGAVGLPVTSVAGPVSLTAGGPGVAAGLTTASAGVSGAADAAKPQGTPFGYAFSPALPAGLTFDPVTGTFSAAAATVPGTYLVTVTTTDVLGQVSASPVQVSITVAPAAATPSPTATPTATASGGAGAPLAKSGVASWPLVAAGAAALLIGGVAVRARRRTQP